MICPNCRCSIPNHSISCQYCGINLIDNLDKSGYNTHRVYSSNYKTEPVQRYDNGRTNPVSGYSSYRTDPVQGFERLPEYPYSEAYRKNSYKIPYNNERYNQSIYQEYNYNSRPYSAGGSSFYDGYYYNDNSNNRYYAGKSSDVSNSSTITNLLLIFILFDIAILILILGVVLFIA